MADEKVDKTYSVTASIAIEIEDIEGDFTLEIKPQYPVRTVEDLKDVMVMIMEALYFFGTGRSFRQERH
jgi:hypothetical protein